MTIPVFMLLCGCGLRQGSLLPGNPYSGQQTTAGPESSKEDKTDFEVNQNFETSPALQEQTTAPDTEQTAMPDTGLTAAPDTKQNTMPDTGQPTAPQAGTRSLENLILTALEPVGSTMYIWGGGWNEADTGAGQEALSIGCSERWAEFAKNQDSTYDYKDHRYQIHDGLDCSGYIGWILYNVFHRTDAGPEEAGYVMKSSLMPEAFAGYGWGELIPAAGASEWKPGDICGMSGHVWLSLGMCRDGSVLLLHASPPGVRLCGTASSNGEKTDAVELAEKWMSVCYPEWYERFSGSSAGTYYLTDSDIMRWNSDTLVDAEQLQALSAEEIAERFMRVDG